MNFKQFSDLVSQRLGVLAQTGKLYRSSLTGAELWDLYLRSFKPEHNPVFRDPESSSHNCNLDNNFIRRYGNIVAIDNNEIITLWDVELPKDSEYYQSTTNMSKILKMRKVEDVFFETFTELNSMNYEKCNKKNSVFRLGIEANHKIYTKEEADKFGVVKEGEVYQFNHFYADLATEFVDMTGNSQASIIGGYRDAKNVFERAMVEIPVDTLELVRDLINQGSLLDGATHLYKIEAIIPLKKQYDKFPVSQKDNWCWSASYKLPFAKFRNELIGTLCVDLAEGVELNKACETWNKRVDPANYMKAKAPITASQINEAKKFVEENGYEESFNRRFATIDDINVSEIAHSNVGKGEIKTASIFDKVQSTSTRHKRSEFTGIEEVSIKKFMKDILPGCTSVEVFLENRMQGNLVALTTSAENSKPIFKWNNPFSWTFNGNLAGKSQLAEMVEAKGGRIDGVFRFTHSWNELEPNQSLMDLHVFMPGNEHTDIKAHNTYGGSERVGWNNRNHIRSGGSQDVDFVNEAPPGYIPVENITFPSLSKMPEGKYICKIHNWSFRKSGGRGKAEIAFQGEVFQYIYPSTSQKEWVTVAEVTLKEGKFSIEHKLPETTSTKKLWNLDTNQFQKVNLVCLSPNHWGENNVGNKHYFFMIDGCKSDVSLRSFHNENLNGDLLAHRKVMEVLGVSHMLEPTDKQLAGIGINATVNDELVVKLKGSHNRIIKLKF